MSEGVSRVEYQSSTRKARSVFQRLGSPVPSSMLKWTSPAWGFRAAIAHDPVRLALTVRVPLGRSVTSQRADAAVQMLQRDTPRGVEVVLRWNTSATFRRSLSSCCSQARGSCSPPTSVADFRYLAADGKRVQRGSW